MSSWPILENEVQNMDNNRYEDNREKGKAKFMVMPRPHGICI